MKKIFIILISSMLIISCNKFDDLNVSPTALSAPTTRGLLTNSMQQLTNLVFGNNAASRNGSLYVQYLAEGPYPASSLYSDRTTSFRDWYIGPLYNLQKIIEYNNDGSPFADQGANGSKNNQIAVARIMKAYLFLNMTDRWGDIPYSEALQGEGSFAPKYDKQEDIYTDLFKELKEAGAQINLTESPVVGDVILNGDMEGWKRFASTTRMVMAMRLSKVDAARGKTEYAAAVADGVITSLAQNIKYTFIAGDPNNYNPWYNNYSVSFRNDYAVSTTLTDYMAPKNDPRLPVYAEVLPSGNVKGLPYGRNAAVNIPAAYSRIGSKFRGAGSPLNIYTYSQILFMEAEAAKIGYTAGGDLEAATKYKSAVEASWRDNGVYDAAAFATYMALPSVAYDPTMGYQKIMTEKWVSLYLNGWESWNDYRRTGYPVLTPAQDAIDPRGIPTRLGYPTNEGTLNKTNYQTAVAEMGGTDDNYGKVWWDVD